MLIRYIKLEMELKANKRFLLLFCLFCLALNSDHDLTPKNTLAIQGGKDGDETHSIALKEDISSYSDYLSIKFSYEDTSVVNPFVFVAEDENCERKMHVSNQLYDHIYIFLKKDQIVNKRFYICVKSREKPNNLIYYINISNENIANIDLDQQTSYYISNEAMKSMTFQFKLGSTRPTNATFWAKGKKINSLKMKDKGPSFKCMSFDSGSLCYGNVTDSDIVITVQASIGDYVTVGSTTLNREGKTLKLKENSNEITIASENDAICVQIDFPEHINQITGKIYNTKTVKAYFCEKDGKIIDDDESSTIINDGIISVPNILNVFNITEEKEGTFCLNAEGLKIFSLQVVNYLKNNLINPPLIPGEIRRHIIFRDQWAIFYGMKPDDEAKEANFNLKALKGFPRMYFDKCTTFPNCHYTNTSFDSMESPLPSNTLTVYSFYLNETDEYRNYNPISEIQPLMIVLCGEGGNTGTFESLVCEFETSYFTDRDTIKIFEGGPFSQFLLEGEVDNYKIQLPENYGEGKKLTIDLMLFSGDADLGIDSLEGKSNKYYLSNKIIYDVTLKKPTESFQVIVKANRKSFYEIEYNLVGESGTEDSIKLESGVNYITSKNLEDTSSKEKHIYMANLKYLYGHPFLVTFYSPNCQIKAFMEYEKSNIEIESKIDNYAQLILNLSLPQYKRELYNFFYTIQEADESEYPRKYCMVYTAGLELTEPGSGWNERSISLSEGVPHLYTFTEEYPTIYYSYHVSDHQKTLVLNFNLIDKSDFVVDIFVNRKQLQNQKTIYRNTQLYVSPKDFKEKCEKEEVCTVTVKVQMRLSKRARKVEFTMYQMDGLPFYLEKNVIKEDIVHGNIPKHYYFDIGKEEYGDITLDFKRGSGNIYASVQKRNLNEPMKGTIEWRGLYHFPMTIDESLNYRTYGKKIVIGEADTEKCDEGCYVLITIISNMNISRTHNFENVPYRISINPRIMKTDPTVESPKVKMIVNEFVIGDIVFGLAKNRIYDYYTVNLPFESEFLIFDFQADSPNLLINVGKERPTITKNHLSFFPLGQDFVYKIERKTLVKAAGLDENQGLRGLDLTIGIYANVSDSIQTSPYAFKIFVPPTLDLITKIVAEVIHIRTDQKVQCLTTEEKVGEKRYKYLCLFAVIFDDMDVERNLIVYPRSRNGEPLTIYGSFFDSKPIEKNDVMSMAEMFEQIYENEDYLVNENYIFQENINKSESYLFVTISKTPNIVEVLSSTYSYENELNIFPNPSTTQIFGIGSNSVSLNFMTTQDLLINIVSVSGMATIYWNDDIEKIKNYYLSGDGDRLSLTAFTEDQEKKLAPLMVDSFEEKKEGFIFYISYYPRNTIDQLSQGRSTEIHYREVKMPINYFAKIYSYSAWTINFNFYDMGLKDNHDLVYDRKIFKIWATVMNESQIVLARFDPTHKPEYDPKKSVDGVFDVAFGTLLLTEDDIKRIYGTETLGPIYLFLSIEKVNNDAPSFSTLGLESSIYSYFQMGGVRSIPEGVYLNGKASSKIDEDRFLYLLQLNRNRPYLRVEYATISNQIRFIISTNVNANHSDNFPGLKNEEISGRKLITVRLSNQFFNQYQNLYVIIIKNQENIDPQLDYFVFQYLTAERETDFIEFIEKDKSGLEVDTSVKNVYKIKLDPIKSYNIIYYIKGGYKNGRIPDEEINTIAISESPGTYMQVIDPPYNSQEKLEFTLNCAEELSYIKVMAGVTKKEKRLFYLYTPYEFEEPEPDPIDIKKSDALIQIPYNFKSNKVKGVAKEVNKVQKYQLTYAEALTSGETSATAFDLLPDYFKIKVITKGDIHSPILYFSPTDENCIKDRLQLTKGNLIQNEMWIKKDQFKGGSLYFVIECYEPTTCGYSLEISGDRSVIFDKMTTYSYYVSEGNTKMLFKFVNEYDYSVDEVLTLYATGGKPINLFLDSCFDETCEQFNFADGSAITINTTNYKYYDLTLTAEKGDYITVGGKVVSKTGRSVINDLKPDSGSVSGFLRRKVLENECYRLPTNEDIYYITGTLYNSIAQMTFLDEKMDPIKDEVQVIREGFFSTIIDSKESKRAFICISFLDIQQYTKESFSYSIQLQSKKQFVNNNYSPQHTGFIYSRITPAGSLVYFNNLYPKEGSKYMVYNMITTKGYPKMYIYDCKTYPNCELDYNNIESADNVQRISEINRMSTFDIKIEDIGSSPIDPHQQILVVKCVQANKEQYDHCEFMTSVFGDQEDVLLLEKQPFGQYMKGNTEDHFLIDISKEKRDYLKVQIDFYVVSGDVSIELKNAENPIELVDAHIYYLANKIFYSIDMTKNENKNLKKIKVNMRCKIPSYYIIEYGVLTYNTDENSNHIYSNINYLIPVFQNENKEGYKLLTIDSVEIVKPESVIVTFYSLNCKIDIKKFGKDDSSDEEDKSDRSLPSHYNFAQDFYNINPKANLTFQNSYNITVENDDRMLISDRDICMIYVAGLEMYNKESGIRKEILVSEGVPQRTLFEDNLRIMRYVYPHANRYKNITVSIHMIVAGKFKVKIFFRDSEYDHQMVYSESTVIYIHNSWIQNSCREGELCTITVELEKLEAFQNNYPQIETTIKQIMNEPYYLPRGIVKNDFIDGNSSLYLYTDVGKSDGYITINFFRGSGFIFARVVQIYQENEEPEANWRKYRFPSTINEPGSLKFDFFSKKILFTEEDTKRCEHGCYILISIKTSIIQPDLQDEDFQFFTLLVDFSPKTYSQAGIVQKSIDINHDEYVIGSLYEKDDIENKGIYEYYHIECPFDDAEGLEIEWQSDTAELYINVESPNPTLNDHKLEFTGRKDTNIYFSKKELLDDEDFTLKYTHIYLGVYTKYYDSRGLTIYSFKVHFFSGELNIYKINDDQKTICKPIFYKENEYRCLFMIIYDKTQYFNDLLAYAKSQAPSATIDMYADFVDNELYNSFNVSELKKLIPEEGKAKYSTKVTKTNFIFFEYGSVLQNAFVSVISDSPEPIEFYTSFKTFEDRLSPDPSSAQVYSMDIYKKDLRINFITSKSIAIRIISLYGEARISEMKDMHDIYHLRGAEDSFDLILKGGMARNSLLTIENLRYNKPDLKNPGFAFLLEFKLRGEFNLDELKLDETSELIYNIADFPVYYYARVTNVTKDINAFFYLHHVRYTDFEKNRRQIVSGELIIKGTILEGTDIYNIKKNETFKPKIEDMDIVGEYDPVMQAGNIIFPSDKLKKEGIKNPVIYIAIDKGEKGKDIEYSRIRGEFGLFTINGDAPVTQKLYQFGKIGNKDEINCFKLIADYNGTEFMRIQFSPNSKYIDLAISKTPNQKVNDTELKLKTKKERGILFITFKKPQNAHFLYLNVFLKSKITDPKLNKFVFKYINAETEDQFVEYKVVKNNTKIKLIKGNNKKVNITFNPIEHSFVPTHAGIFISYTVKLITSKPNDEYLNVITMTDDNVIAKQVGHARHFDSNPITVEFENVPDNYKYCQVISTIIEGPIIEYISYQAVNSEGKNIIDYMPPSPSDGDDEKKDDGNKGKEEKKSDKTTLAVVISVSTILLVVVIILIVIILRYNSKNKDLAEKVKQISFAQSKNEQRDENLLLGNKNELD